MLDKIHSSVKRSLIVFSLTFVVSVSAVSFSHVYLEGVSEDEAKVKRSMRVWRNNISEARENNNTIVKQEKRYLELIKNGIVGDERRLSWFETLQTTASSRGLDSFRYSTAKQVKVKTKVLRSSFNSIYVFKSTMTLAMKIGHEGDLFAIFNDLDANAKGLYAIDECNVNRSKSTRQEAGSVAATMQANCKLTWYTFKPAGINPG